MTKQEKIQEAYGKYWEQVKDYIDKNGWCSVRRGVGFDEIISKLSWETRTDNQYCWRPKSLQGIEDNNGWIKIESENDLPKEDCHCWIMDKEKGLQSGQWKQAPNEILHKQACFYWMKKATHYQIIEKPKPPIY